MDSALRGRATVADLVDVAVEAVVELGRAVMPLRHARQLRAGDVVSLGKLAGETATVLLNGMPVAEGEIIVIDDLKCCRLVRLAPPATGAPEEAT